MPTGDDERQDTTGAPRQSKDKADGQAVDVARPAATGAPAGSDDKTAGQGGVTEPPATTGPPPGSVDAERRGSGTARATGEFGGDAMTSAIGRHLKESYNKLLREPVPQRFLDLLDELEAKTSERGRPANKHEDGA